MWGGRRREEKSSRAESDGDRPVCVGKAKHESKFRQVNTFRVRNDIILNLIHLGKLIVGQLREGKHDNDNKDKSKLPMLFCYGLFIEF
jgi:hypothetical protein